MSVIDPSSGTINPEELQKHLSSLTQEEAPAQTEAASNESNQNTDANVEQKTEKTNISEENSTETEKNKPENDFDTLYQERFQKEISEGYVTKSEYDAKLDELQKSLDEAKNKKPQYRNTITDKVTQLDAKGISVTAENLPILLADYSQFNFTDPKQAMSLVRQELKLDGYLSDQVDKLLKMDYPALFDEDAEQSEKDTAELKLSRAAKSSLEKLKEIQSGLQEPTLLSSQSKEDVIKSYNEGLQEQQEQTNAFYKETAERLTKDLSSFSHDVDGVEYKVDVTDLKSEIQAEIESIKLNPTPYVNYDAQGNPVSLKENEILNRAIKIAAVDKILTESIKQAKSNGSEATEREIKNTNFNNKQQEKTELTSEEQELAEFQKELQGQFSFRRR